ncbi:MAG: hypothetical protein Q8865_04030 [Bacillota bacterium]|nr:hypothetical protein [Bacillota bacterium]
MVNGIIDGISVKLNGTFGDGYKIYSDTVEQGFSEPCFFILALDPSQTPLLGNRYLRQHPFDVHYFPAKPDNSELHSIGSALFCTLEFITLSDGSLARGTDMKYEIVDNVLHFFVSFDLIVKKIAEAEDPMGELKTDMNVKG